MIDRWGRGPGSESPVDECVYGSRLIGNEPTLTLHGGGNTSVKIDGFDVTGRPAKVLFVKGSGFDLATITPEGFAPLDQLGVARLAELESLSDKEMMNALLCLRYDSQAPSPSVEAILHALIPHAAVQHSHADAILALTDNEKGREISEELFGEQVLYLDYIMPGFPLAKACGELVERELRPGTLGIVLARHGIFTFGTDTKTAYTSMMRLVSAAEEYLSSRRGPRPAPPQVPQLSGAELAALRRRLSAVAGRPMILASLDDPAALRLANDPRRFEIATRGPITPDHVIRTKRAPCVDLDVEGYAKSYEETFLAEQKRVAVELRMLDPAPRVLLHPDVGVLVAGGSARDAAIAGDVYAHTAAVIEDAEDLGGYRPVNEHESFDMEYWELEQAKLARERAPLARSGEVALVTGAASGIGRAIAERLLEDGAAVVGLDISEAVAEVASRVSYVPVVGDVREAASLGEAVQTAARSFGGLDILVVSAGVFAAVEPIAELSEESWEKSFSVNVGGALSAMKAAFPLLAESPRGGRVVIVGSKNVAAPGRGAAAYSASKAALNQLARVAALEWAEHGIRVNSVHPDAVFDTGLWSEELLAARAESYKMTVEEYKRRNLLAVEVTSTDVAELVALMCGEAFSKVTGAGLPIDGGNERVV